MSCKEFRDLITNLGKALEESVTLLLSKAGCAVRLNPPPHYHMWGEISIQGVKETKLGLHWVHTQMPWW